MTPRDRGMAEIVTNNLKASNDFAEGAARRAA
jgi:hypothetical protein